MKGRVDLLYPLHQPGGNSYYILFEGSESDVAFWSQLSADLKIKDTLDKASANAAAVFTKVVPHHTYFIFRLETIKLELQVRVKRITHDAPHLQIVSLSNLYNANGWVGIEINRMIDLSDKLLAEAGPRPGAPPIKVQIARLQRSTGDKQVILVDDVCFKGQTSKTLIQQGMRVVGIIGGVITSSAITTLTKRRLVARDLDGVITNVSYQRALKLHPILTVGQGDDTNGDFVDTCPLHDFIPFTPYCGLTIGVQTHQVGPIPLMHGGVSFTKPYLLPYLDKPTFEAKASIPADCAVEFSQLMIANAINMYEELSTVLGYELTPRILANLDPNCSYPLAKGKGLWDVDLDEPVTLILKGDLEAIGRT